MNTILVIFSLLSVGVMGLTDEQITKLTAEKTACIAETGVDPALIDNAKKGEFSDDQKLACFSSCLLKKIGIMNADGTINEEVARAKAPSNVSKKDVEEVLNKCKGQKGSNDCETAKLVLKCAVDTKKISLLN